MNKMLEPGSVPMEKSKNQLRALIESLIINKYYGKLEISFESGVPIAAKEIRNIKFGTSK